MMHLKNITAGEAKTEDQRDLTRDFGVVWLWSDDGKDWYEELKNFTDDTVKIAYNREGVVCAIENDVTRINPIGLSVVEIPAALSNGNADISGGWVFRDGEIQPREYSQEELRVQAEEKKAELLSVATTAIAPLQDAVDLDIATDEEKTQLLAWKKYRVLLNRVNTSKAPDIGWPEVPGHVA